LHGHVPRRDAQLVLDMLCELRKVSFVGFGESLGLSVFVPIDRLLYGVCHMPTQRRSVRSRMPAPTHSMAAL
jgi:hypothetical protein